MLSLGVTQRGSGLVDVLERLAIHWYMAVGVRVCVGLRCFHGELPKGNNREFVNEGS